MYGFADECIDADATSAISYEQAESTTVIEPFVSLQTPLNTHALNEDDQLRHNTDFTPSVIVQREPTPLLLRDIDHVSLSYCSFSLYSNNSDTEVFLAPSHVFHSLDQRVS